MLVKTINNKDYTDNVKCLYNLLSNKFKYSARITDFWQLLLTCLGKKEFDILDLKTFSSYEFEAYLIDELIKWRNGEEINFTDIYNEVLKAGEFTRMEKLILSTSAEEIIWAIYLVITDPELNLK